MKNNLIYYKEHDIMTEIKTMEDMVINIPKNIKTIVSYVQNILLHQHWGEAYGLKLSDKRKKEPFIRRFEDKLIFLRNIGYDNVSDKKKNENKMIGICRDFTIAAVALCRKAGIPARARCGFASYLEKGKYIDHWVLEYWNEDKNRWVMVDAQLDDVQIEVLKVPFDPLDVSEEYFITGPRAWMMCREGLIEPEVFGIFKWWGYDYLRCNLILDANSLLKIVMQPWDMWEGYKNMPIEEWRDRDYEVMDHLSILAMNVDNNFNDLYNYVHTNHKIKVPKDLDKVINSLR